METRPAHTTWTHRVEWGETDAAGIVFYPNYFRWFDRGTHRLFQELGFPVRAMLQRGYAIPIVEAKARFLAALGFEDELTVHTRVSEVRTRAFRVEHSFLRGEQPVCDGYEVRMWVHMGTEGAQLVPEAIPDNLRRLLAPG